MTTTAPTPENDLTDSYIDLAKEVKQFVRDHRDILSTFPNYRGVQILFSEIRHKPKFMLIGINPGEGYLRNNGQNVEKYEPTEELEYLEETYRLGEETKHLFDLAGCFNDLFTTVKTNWSFFATPNSKDLDSLLKTFLYEYKINLYEKFDDWSRRLIEMVQPEIIICEGKWSFDRVSWNVLNCRDTTAFQKVGYRQAELCRHIIGYKRNPFSQIKEKQEVAKKIAEVAHGRIVNEYDDLKIERM